MIFYSIALYYVVKNHRDMDTNQGGLSELLPERIQTSYLAKMVAVFVVIGLVVASVGAYSYVDTSQRVKAETQQELVANAEIQAAQLSTWLEEHYHVARLVSGEAALDAVIAELMTRPLRIEG